MDNRVRQMIQRWRNFLRFQEECGKLGAFHAYPLERAEAEAAIGEADQIIELGFPEKHLRNDFGNVNAANSSEKEIPSWCKALWCLFRNSQRKFPANISNDTGRSNQENLRAEIFGPNKPALICAAELASKVKHQEEEKQIRCKLRGENSEAPHCKFGDGNFHGGVEGIENDFATSTTGGISSDPELLPSKRKENYWLNKLGASAWKVSWTILGETLLDKTIVIPGTCALVSLVLGVGREGFPNAVQEGLGLITATGVLIAVIITARRNYRQYSSYLQCSQNSNGKNKKITLHEVSTCPSGDGCGQKISISDILPGDVFHLRSGDKVPADGLFLSGSFVVINDESPSQVNSSSSCHSQEQLKSGDTRMENPNDLNRVLVANLESPLIEEQKQAALVIRFLTKDSSENRIKIANSGAIKPLIQLLSSSDRKLQAHAVAAVLNLSHCKENKELIVSSKAIKPLVEVLKKGTSRVKRNAACALFHLSQGDDKYYCKASIGWLEAIPPLVKLLDSGSLRAKKDAATALYSLCSVKENKVRAVRAGIMKPLLRFMDDFGSDMMEKATCVLSVLVPLPEAKMAFVDEGGILVLLKMIESGWRRMKEIAVAILLEISQDCEEFRNMVADHGDLIVPCLLPLSQFSTANYAMQKAKTLIELLMNPVFENTVGLPLPELDVHLPIDYHFPR